MKPQLLKLLDGLERTAWTFAQSFAGAVVVTGKLDVLDLKIAAVAGVIAVLKSISVGASVATGTALAEEQPLRISYSPTGSTTSASA